MILFVDDEKPFDAVALTSSLEALEMFCNMPYQFDLDITDQVMPDLTGMELAKRIRKIRPDLPIIMCSGFAEAITPEKAKESDIRHFVSKPFTVTGLAKALRKVPVK